MATYKTGQTPKKKISSFKIILEFTVLVVLLKSNKNQLQRQSGRKRVQDGESTMRLQVTEGHRDGVTEVGKRSPGRG